MTSIQNRAGELRNRAQNLQDGPAKVALLEESVQLADSVNDVDLAFQLRQDLMYAANFSGRPDVLLTTFSQCLALYDSDPRRFDRDQLLWKYKWVIVKAEDFPEISRPQMEALAADLERRFREAGATLYAVHEIWRAIQMHYGERQAARVAHRAVRRSRRDFLSDCAACVASSDCVYFTFQRQWALAVKAAQPVLQGRLTCREQPHRILSNVLLPLFHLRRFDEAKAFQRRGYRAVSTPKHYVNIHASHLQFLALVGELNQARRLLERHLPGALDTVSPDDRFQFLLAAMLWTELALNRGPRDQKLRLPETVGVPVARGSVDLSALQAWFMAQAREIARRYDARNGTGYYQWRIDEISNLVRLAVK